ncbi:aminoacyl-tRNA hydrolase [Halobacteriales archaeon QH_7_65_31]|nr:MAG: aminoacyl-tRNA hydrolase [Halobacteriales archaeon QH_7_65_31]
MKQAIVVRTDIGMGTGKLAAQASHASLKAYENSHTASQSDWKADGQKKIVLAVASEREIHELAEQARREGLPNAVISDAGYTQLEPGTVTALAVGPGEENLVDRVTGDLSLV